MTILENNDVSYQLTQKQLGGVEALEFFPSAAIFCSPQGVIISFNSKAASLLREPHLEGRDIADYIEADTESDGATLPSQNVDQRRFKLKGLHEHYSPLHGSVQFSRDSENRLTGCFYQFESLVSEVCEADWVHSDCLERLRQVENELLSARQASARASAAKSEFLSNMSHELRTPLNAVIGMSDVLWETQLTDEQRQLLAVLKNGGKNLLAIINDILDHSRLENGQFSLESTSFEIATTLASVLDSVRDLAESKEIELKLDIDPKIGRVTGDPKRLQQVLMKLVGNALKFTDHGSIRIQASRDVRMPHDVHFSIADTGIGIPADRLNELFQRFTQIDSSVTKSYGGTGLGLAIAKQLVELMDGVIWAESQLGKGSTFHFKLRLPSVETPTEIALPILNTDVQIKASLRPLKILVVEDSKDNAFLVSKYLKNIDCELEFAQNGRVAVDMFGKSEYDLILMDMQMPEMDGYAATRWIRILEMPRARRVPIIALTAFTFADEVQKCLDAGCDVHLGKPINKSLLLRAIEDRVALRDCEASPQLNQCEI